MTPEELAQSTRATLDRAAEFLPIIESASVDFEINTPKRMAAFLAQVGHESGGLHWLTELWGPTPAQSRYEGRADLGNTQKDDGFKYRGRGLIQITGRSNSSAAALHSTVVEGTSRSKREPTPNQVLPRSGLFSGPGLPLSA